MVRHAMYKHQVGKHVITMVDDSDLKYAATDWNGAAETGQLESN
jgi:hypothetical protein